MQSCKKKLKSRSKPQKPSHNPQETITEKSLKNSFDADALAHEQLVSALKNSTDYVLRMYKLLHETPITGKVIDDVRSYAQNIEELLKQFLDRFSAVFKEHAKMKESYERIELKNQKLVRENIDFKCEVDVLGKELEGLRRREGREAELQQERVSRQRNAADFPHKHSGAKESSVERIRKLREAEKALHRRKKSLPLINTVNADDSRRKVLRMFHYDSAESRERTDRLIRHLSRKC